MFECERVYFRLGAESYSSLGRVGKKEEKNVVALRSLLNVFACGQVSSPRLYRLITDLSLQGTEKTTHRR